MGITSTALTTGDAPISTQVPQNPTVEPLSGPVPMAHLMRRFPEQVYQQGPDTHLYHFVSALCGDAGAGLLKKQSYLARLAIEGEVLQYTSIDDFYVQHFGFKRLRTEVYDLDPTTMTMTPAEWDDITSKDDSYKHRIQSFFAAARLGPTKAGMELAAEAGSGVECEVRPHYRFIYDAYSDDPLGIDPVGRTESVNEFVVLPRVKGTSLIDTAYEADFDYAATPSIPSYSIPTPSSHEAGRPITIENARTVDGTITEVSTLHLDAYAHHNMLDVLDRLRPVTSTVTLRGQQFRRSQVSVNSVASSSDRIRMSRFINGSPQVEWPSPDRETGYFIEADVENENRYYANQHTEILVLFHTIEGVIAYTDDALSDTAYNTTSFYEDGSGIPPRVIYESTHDGSFSNFAIAVYPALAFENDRSHSVAYTLPAQNTVLTLDEGVA